MLCAGSLPLSSKYYSVANILPRLEKKKVLVLHMGARASHPADERKDKEYRVPLPLARKEKCPVAPHRAGRQSAGRQRPRKA